VLDDIEDDRGEKKKTTIKKYDPYSDVPWCRLRSTICDIASDHDLKPKIIFDSFVTNQQKIRFLKEARAALTLIEKRLAAVKKLPQSESK